MISNSGRWWNAAQITWDGWLLHHPRRWFTTSRTMHSSMFVLHKQCMNKNAPALIWLHAAYGSWQSLIYYATHIHLRDESWRLIKTCCVHTIWRASRTCLAGCHLLSCCLWIRAMMSVFIAPSNEINPHLLNSVLVIKNMKIVCIMDHFKTSLTMHTFTSHCICHYSYDLYNYPVKGWYLENVMFLTAVHFWHGSKGCVSLHYNFSKTPWKEWDAAHDNSVMYVNMRIIPWQMQYSNSLIKRRKHHYRLRLSEQDKSPSSDCAWTEFYLLDISAVNHLCVMANQINLHNLLWLGPEFNFPLLGTVCICSNVLKLNLTNPLCKED